MGSRYTCSDCRFCQNGYCQAHDDTVNPESAACPEFEEK